jgi:NADPH:quinone reductase
VEVLDYPDDPQQFGVKVRELSGGKGVAAVYDGMGKSTFDASLSGLAILGTLVLFGAASAPMPPFDPQRLNAVGSVFLNFMRTATSLRGVQANCSTRSPPAPSR